MNRDDSVPLHYESPERLKKEDEGISFLHGFADRTEELVKKEMQTLYGDEWRRALNLWQALLTIRHGRGMTPAVKAFRKNFASALSQKNFVRAEQMLESQVTDTPHLFSDTTARLVQKIHDSVSARQPDIRPEKELSEKQKKELLYFESLLGTAYKTKGGKIFSIHRVARDLRSLRGGFHPGVEVIRMAPDRKHDDPTHLVEIKREIFSPSELMGKMTREEWQRI